MRVARDHPKDGEVWKSFQDRDIKIVGVGTHTDTGAGMVVYLEESGKLKCHPLLNFLGKVLWNKQMVWRFERIS